MMKRLLSTIAVAVVCAGASFAGGAPDWLGGTSSKYPADKYLIGVGLADSLDGARGNARAEVAKVFKAQVTQKAQETQSEKTVQSGRKTSTASSVEASVNTRVATDMQLEGVEIAETWFDPKKAIQYALAVLDKQKLRIALAQQITDQEQAIQAQLTAAKSAASAIDEVRAYTAALAAYDKKQEIAARKRVIDPVGAGDVDAVSRTEIKQKQSAALNKIRFIVDAGPEKSIKELVGGRISGLGFKVMDVLPTSDGGETVIFMRCSTSIALLERNNPEWKFYTYQCTVEMLDWFNNEKVLASDSKEGQSAQLSDDAAKQKAVLSSKQETANIAETLIKSYIFGE